MKKFIISYLLIVFNSLFAQQQHEISIIPIPGEKYIVSAWVSEDNINQITFKVPKIKILVTDNGGSILLSQDFKPTGAIIDGWQKIVGVFTIPQNGTFLLVKLFTEPNKTAYFDDLRLHPFSSNFKSFVYNEKTNRLEAELDENNYATFYEYDNEGGLIRVKKETEKGIYTIKETRSSTKKL